MEFLNITLESLLADSRIRRVQMGKVWYFAQADLNLYYDDNFKYVDSKMLEIRESNFAKKIPFISAAEVIDHVEYNRNKPSFGSLIDKVFGKGK